MCAPIWYSFFQRLTNDAPLGFEMIGLLLNKGLGCLKTVLQRAPEATGICKLYRMSASPETSN
jgi:hypothetical protein